MGFAEVWRFSKIGLETCFTATKFFYSHFSLLFVSFISASIRAFQMLYEDAPFSLEGVVVLARCFLFILIISKLTGVKINKLKNKDLWDKLGKTWAVQFNKNWPYGFLSQIIVFLALLFGLGNLIITLLSRLFVTTLEFMDFPINDLDGAYHASVYFLKNMSVIPLTIVYMLYVCGFPKK